MDTLRKLESAHQYLFHGTATDNITLFEPRQAMSHGNKDGAPCIAASEHADPAIFMAIFGSRVPCGWDANDSSFGFYVKKSDYQKAKAENWSGFVYAFDKENFKPYRAWEWRAHTNVKPLKKLRASFADLPNDINLT